MSNIVDKLQTHITQLESIFTKVDLYASKNQLNGIEEPACILNYTLLNNSADGSSVHFSTVTLSVYVANNSDKSEELRELGYEVVAETEIDDKLNTYQVFNKEVLIL